MDRGGGWDVVVGTPLQPATSVPTKERELGSQANKKFELGALQIVIY